ncbi:hypothetical protein [Pseudomonas sp. BF-R-01]|uniref:hypothetical protein n=1 Tax=Pseudomonas sp. BF-R-01 TaxID=2832365 RepID=UPI001CC16ACE|nr:hypothetical protein [Pseudomonas sp. BF-R-01]
MTNQPKARNETLEACRLLVRHKFFWVVIGCLFICIWVFIWYSLAKAIVVALAFYPLLTAVWYYTTTDIVHGPSFKQMSRTAQLNTIFRILGLCMSAAAFSYALPKLF